MDNYSPTLEVTMVGQTATQTLNVKPFYNQVGSLSADYNQVQARIDEKMRQQEQEIAAEIESLQAVGAEQNYTVGDTEDFYLTDHETPVITAVLEAKGDKSMIFVEEGVDVKKEADLNEIKNGFDNNIFATNMKYFGRPQNENYNEIYDIDKNDKLIILITDVSNYFNLSGTVLGFFHPKDMKDSEYSNQADMIYLNSQALNSNQYDLETMLGTLAHEFQHLLFFVEKKNAGREEEDTWINEGFAVMASFLNGYYSYQEDSRIYNSDYGYFAEPYSESLLNWNNYLSDYGASSLFARYIYEEFGNRIFRDVMTSQDRPREVLAEQRKFDQLFLDWGLTNLISNSIAKDRYSYSVKLTSQPAKTTINQAGKVDFTVGSTAWKYFKIKGNGEEVSLKLTGLDQKTGVVVCK